ncbi:EcsC family protein [Fictibacillus sp. KU28468]|uniref:EcsC family protein n=1 Tax=Fictibacillus sp. KU28468 TaxID=2991053 RepID=UPI00223DAA68|nr:EcsC family protein [Fictibacillus sp. KU28468]UZJ78710.1 EcsC family protein [Fictibacillus sp. KU28468]
MRTIETRDNLTLELTRVEKWEKDQKDLWFWEKLGRIPFMFLDKITPKFLQDKMLQIVDEIGSYVHNGGKYLVSKKSILKKMKEFEELPEDFTAEEIANLPLASMDKTASYFKSSRAKMATVQGATTGIGGLFTLGIDIPLVLGLSLKTLQEIAISYGYDPNEKEERIFIIKCLQFASSDYVGKRAILEQLSMTDAERDRQAISQLQGWREVIAAYRDNFGWKKLFQMVPVAGIIFGAFINKSTIEEVAETGMMLYRKRRILERLHLLDEEPLNE